MSFCIVTMSVRLILSEGFLIVLTSIAEVRPLGEYEAGFGLTEAGSLLGSPPQVVNKPVFVI